MPINGDQALANHHLKCWGCFPLLLLLLELVVSAAGRGVVQVAAHERCVLVQCTIHKNLHFKNSIARLFRQAGHGA
jgi:hypothetical protein